MYLPLTVFLLLTSPEAGISPQNLLTFSFNPYSVVNCPGHTLYHFQIIKLRPRLMEYYCHIFFKYLVFQMKNLVF